MFDILRKCQSVFHSDCYYFTFLAAFYESSNTCYQSFLFIGHPSGWEVVSDCGFDWLFLDGL